jgi:hypothetical protein
VLKPPLDAIYRTAIFSNNIGKGLLFTKLIGGSFFYKDLLFKLMNNFRPCTGVRALVR